MTFWQLVSAFRENQPALRAVLGSAAWSQTWGKEFERFDDLVQRQVREILDAPVPLELSRAVARSDERTWSLDSTGHLRLGEPSDLRERLLTTLEVHDEFGGWVLEEVQEWGSLRVGREGDTG